MLIHNLTQTFGDEVALSQDRQASVVPDEIAKNDRKVIVPEKFRADVEALKQYAESNLSSGLCIEVSLQELLTICPRERKRTDAYSGLQKFLSEEMGVNLNIKTIRK